MPAVTRLHLNGTHSRERAQAKVEHRAKPQCAVQDSVYDQFVEQATELAKARQVGVGWDAGSQQGSQVSKEQVDNIMKYIDHGKNEGAELMFGGNRWGDKGHFLEPTVFAGVTDDMIIAKEEIFGPVMSILKFSDAEEVITRANSSEYGLGASVFTKDFNKARMTADKLRSGTVWVNTCVKQIEAAGLCKLVRIIRCVCFSVELT